MAKKKSTIKFLKTREVKSPDRGNRTDAGIDFFVPKFNKEFIERLAELNPKIFGKDNSERLEISGILSVNYDTSNYFTDNNTSNDIEYTQDEENKYEDIIKFDTTKGKPYVLLKSHQGITIPSGVRTRMAEEDRALIGANKGGIASKYGVIFGAHVIDYEYQGEIHINVINTSTDPIRIYEDMKLIQFIETPIILSDLNVETYDNNKDFSIEDKIKEFYEGHESKRGEGKFGSTNDKIQK